MINNQELWQNTLVHIEMNTTEATFKTWFTDTHIVKNDSGTIYIGVPNKMAKDWLVDRHSKFILKTLRGFDENVRSVEYIISKNTTKKPVLKPKNNNTLEQQNNLLSNETLIDRRDNLNPKYLFESFVIGPFNQLAHAAAQAVIQNPGLTYNPLFIYGSTGHGKTHLIQAIGNYLKKTNPNRKVFYVTSEKFAVDFQNAILSGKANNFKDKYRQYDVLIMDDVQFIANKEKTKEELFHILNSMHDNNKQVIFSSDVHPNYMPGIEERLKGRFSAGMIAEIPAPDMDSRMSILRQKALQHNFEVPEKIIEYVAREVHGNIRELEGILNNIICKTQIKGVDLDENEVYQIIKHNLKPAKNISIEDVVQKISKYYEVEVENIYKKTRKKEFVKPRQVIMYILREDFDISFPNIGEKLGGRDHTTVIHSCEKIKREVGDDKSLEQEITRIRALVHN